MANLMGQVILNRYSVRKFLGNGGMAEVYKVWDNQRNSYLAMKVLHEKLAQDSRFLDNFRQEAKTLSQLKHPNIVRFYGFEQDRVRSYILMDFIEGQTLKEKIKAKYGSPFQVKEITKLLSPVLVALQFAHNKGLIHCDIKPANIMVDETGKVLLTDFGIARVSYFDSHSISSSGTPAYMAPEQIRNQAPVPETDIYALGVVLYEMLTGGNRPFNGTQAQTGGSSGERIRWEQLHLQHPSPYRWNPSLHPNLHGILDKALAKEIPQRYHSAIDLSNALNSVKDVAAPKTQTTAKPEKTPHIVTEGVRETVRTKKEVRPRTGTKMALWPVGLFFFVAVAITFALVFSGNGSGSTSEGGSSPNIPTAGAVAEVTHTPFAKFIVLPYQKARYPDAVLVYSDDVEALTKPGRTTGTFTLQAGEKARLAFGWCAAEQGILAENLSHMREEVKIDGQTINPRSFTIIEAQVGDLWCKTYNAVISGWVVGEHTFIRTQYFDREINDGDTTYPAGEYIQEYFVTVK